MKLKLLPSMIILSVVLFSCSQDNDEIPPPPTPATTYPVAGLWIGTYTVTQLPALQPLPYSFAFNPDHTLFTAGKGDDGNVYFAEGTWTMSADSIITANYETINYGDYQVTQSATMKYHSDGTMTNATWTDVTNPAGHLDGNFQNLTRVN